MLLLFDAILLARETRNSQKISCHLGSLIVMVGVWQNLCVPEMWLFQFSDYKERQFFCTIQVSTHKNGDPFFINLYASAASLFYQIAYCRRGHIYQH